MDFFKNKNNITCSSFIRSISSSNIRIPKQTKNAGFYTIENRHKNCINDPINLNKSSYANLIKEGDLMNKKLENFKLKKSRENNKCCFDYGNKLYKMKSYKENRRCLNIQDKNLINKLLYQSLNNKINFKCTNLLTEINQENKDKRSLNKPNITFCNRNSSKASLNSSLRTCPKPIYKTSDDLVKMNILVKSKVFDINDLKFNSNFNGKKLGKIGKVKNLFKNSRGKNTAFCGSGGVFGTFGNNYNTTNSIKTGGFCTSKLNDVYRLINE